MKKNITARYVLRVLHWNDCYTLENLPKLATALNVKSQELSEFAKTDHDDKKKYKNNKTAAGVVVALAGDFLSPNVLTPIDKGRSYLRAWNALGVTHCCFGNHEADLQLDNLQDRIKGFRGKWLNSNIPSFDLESIKYSPQKEEQEERNKKQLPLFDVVNIGDLRVGIIGLLSDEPNVFAKNTFKGFPIGDVVQTSINLETYLREKKGCNAVIALTHQSIHRDRELAEKSNLDCIIGGHDHVPMKEMVQDTLIVKTGMDAVNVGCTDIRLSSAASNSSLNLTIDSELYLVSSFEENKKVTELVQTSMNAVSDLESAVALTGHCLDGRGSRFKQTTLGRALTSSVRDELGADLCVINGATIKGEEIENQSELNYRQLQECLPFPTKMVVVQIPGSVLQDAIRYSRQSLSHHAEKRGFLQTDDWTVLENETVTGVYGDPSDDRESDSLINTNKDTLVSIDKKPFHPKEMYSVAVPRNLLKGFCEIKPFLEWAAQHELPEPDNFRPALELVTAHSARKLWQRLSTDQKSPYNLSFEDIDINKDGHISREELEAAFSTVLNNESTILSSVLVDDLLHVADLDSDGFIDKEEYDAIMEWSRDT